MPNEQPVERATWNVRFRERRLKLGLSQETVAELAGVSQQAVSIFEGNPSHTPRLATLERYAAALQTSVEDLFPMEARP